MGFYVLLHQGLKMIWFLNLKKINNEVADNLRNW